VEDYNNTLEMEEHYIGGIVLTYSPAQPQKTHCRKILYVGINTQLALKWHQRSSRTCAPWDFRPTTILCM